MSLSQGELTRRSRTAHGAEFQRLLKELRESRKWSQTELAQELGRSPSLVSLLESGTRLPTRSLVAELARVLALSSDEEQRLLSAAGFPAEELATAIQQVVAIIDKLADLDETDRAVVHADLLTVATSWRTLFQGARILRMGKLREANEYFRQMARHPEYSPGLRVALAIRRAEVLVQLGKLTPARRLLEKATRGMARWPKEWLPTLRAETVATQGMVALREGMYTLAQQMIEASLQAYSKLLRSGTAEAFAYQGLGKSYKRLAQLTLFQDQAEEALQYCHTAESYLLRTQPSTTHDLWLRRTKELRAWAHSKLGDFAHAIELHTQARDESARAADEQGKMKGHLYIGDDIRRVLQTRIAQAEEASGYQPCTPAQRRDLVKRALQPDGMEWIERAEKAYSDAVDESNRLADEILLGRGLLGLGVILRLKATLADRPDDYALAQGRLDEALALEREIGQGRRVPSVYAALAELAWEQGEQGARGWLQRAKRCYQEALDALNAPLISSQDVAGERFRNELSRAIDMLAADTDEQQSIPTADRDDVINPGAPREWRELCQQLVDVLHGAIRALNLSPCAESQYAPEWYKRLCDLEEMEGPRVLAQNHLSASLSQRMSAGTPAEAANLFHRRYDAFVRNVRTDCEVVGREPNRDLCCRETIAHGLENADTQVLYREQVREAATLMSGYSQGYVLTASIYEVPLAFMMKGDCILTEMPAELAPLFPSKSSTDSSPDLTPCYAIEDANTARKMRELFARLIAEAEKHTQKMGSTKDWLQDLVERDLVTALPRGTAL